ncbi:MAG TPA: alcohol dehydrogenase catalytic domain-containing protein [Candidatus Limnocylindria bacterium]|nr:alcohol dehydrogenase catalytic domain-containing protein [Candidatus Limnocylindria bacterium]
MTAAILYGREDLRIEAIERPALAAGEVRVRVKAALTCGTDLKVYRRGYHARMLKPPSVFGHEFAGVIEELGPDVSGWALGDRVVGANSAPCGQCFSCQHEQENLCDDLQFLNGAYSQSMVIPSRFVQKNLLRLKPDTSFPDAALTEPLACVVQGCLDLRLVRGESVFVLGAGPIGLMFVALAREAGCEVSISGRGAERLAAARRLGAAHVFDLGDGADLLTLVKASGLRPPDVVVEAVGKPETWDQAIRLVRKGGRVNLFGGCPSGTTVAVDTGLVHYSALTLLASFHHTPRAIRRALELIEAGVIRADDFVTGRAPLSRLPELFREMAAGNRAVKTCLDVDA